jgi:hypothetical protein
MIMYTHVTVYSNRNKLFIHLSTFSNNVPGWRKTQNKWNHSIQPNKVKTCVKSSDMIMYTYLTLYSNRNKPFIHFKHFFRECPGVTQNPKLAKSFNITQHKVKTCVKSSELVIQTYLVFKSNNTSNFYIVLINSGVTLGHVTPGHVTPGHLFSGS